MNFQTGCRFHGFSPLMSFFWPYIQQRIPPHICCPISSVPLTRGCFLQSSLVAFTTFTFLKSMDRLFCRMSFSLCLLVINYSKTYGFSKTILEVPPCPSPGILSGDTRCPNVSFLMLLILIRWLRWSLQVPPLLQLLTLVIRKHPAGVDTWDYPVHTAPHYSFTS